MKIIVAGDEKDIAEETTIGELIILEKVQTPEYVTVAVNDEFVDQRAFASCQLKEGDRVEFLYFMGGGQ
jgi:sulfur carrier protein